MKPELDETNRIHTSCKICLWKIYWGPFNFHFTYQIPNRHWIKPLLPAHALRRKPTAPSPGDYTNHFGIKSCRRKKNNYSHKSSPSHFSQIVMVHLSTCTPLSSVIRAGRDVGKNEFSLCFRHLLAILKTYKSLAIFFHSKRSVPQSSCTSLAAPQLQPRMADLATTTLHWSLIFDASS